MPPTSSNRFLSKFTYYDALNIMKRNTLTVQLEQTQLLDEDYIPIYIKEELVQAIQTNAENKDQLIELCTFIQSCGRDQIFYQGITAKIAHASFENFIKPNLTSNAIVLKFANSCITNYIKSMNTLDDYDINIYINMFHWHYSRNTLHNAKFLINSFQPKSLSSKNLQNINYGNMSIFSHTRKKMWHSLYISIIAQILDFCLQQVTQKNEIEIEKIQQLKQSLNDYYKDLQHVVNKEVIKEIKTQPNGLTEAINLLENNTTENENYEDDMNSSDDDEFNNSWSSLDDDAASIETVIHGQIESDITHNNNEAEEPNENTLNNNPLSNKSSHDQDLSFIAEKMDESTILDDVLTDVKFLFETTHC
jgi:predicted nucleic acid-binding protein